MTSELWVDLWTRPGDPNFGRRRDYLPFRSAGAHVGINRVGEGNLELPDSFIGFDDILKTDSDTPANSQSSLVRIYSAEDPTVPIAEWLPSEIFPGGDKDNPYTKVTGVGINGILGYARLEAFDWDGSDNFSCNECDWTYGGSNILGNAGFENPNFTPVRYELFTDATGGDFTLSDGTDTTGAIAFDASSLTIETELQTFASITDVLVVGLGSETNPWVIEFHDPPVGVLLTANFGGLTGGDGTLTLTQEGVTGASPWTEARFVGQNTQPFGQPTTWEVSTDQNHTPGGQYSVKIQTSSGSPGFAGVQQVLSVTPGTHQASVWIYPTSGSDVFGIVVRTLGEDFIDSSTGGLLGGTTLTPNQWNELTITDLEIPEGTTQIIFRVVQSNPGASGVWYVDDGSLISGLAATTVGAILGDIYDHAVDATLRDTLIVWDDGSGTDTPYLTIDFTDAVDSNGNAWDDDEISTRLTMRQSYSQIMANLANEYGYEYRIIPNDAEAGTWLWQVFNPGGMDTSPDVAVQGGASDTRRQFRRQAPSGTDQMVEGLGRITARARNTGLMNALGRIEASELSREATELSSVTSAASRAISEALQDISSVAYTLIDPQDEPLSDYTIGDTVTIVDPPDIPAASKRFVDLEVSISPNAVEWECSYGALVVTNADAAVADAVAGLLTKFEYPDPEQAGGPVSIGGGGGTPTVVVASSDALDIEKEKADFICPGVNDQDTIQAASDLISAVTNTPGRILLVGDTFNLSGGFTLDINITLQGLGISTVLNYDQTTGEIITAGSGCRFRDLTISAQAASGSTTGVTAIDCEAGANHIFEGVRFFDVGTAIKGGQDSIITACTADFVTWFVDASGGAAGITIVGNGRVSSGLGVGGIQLGDGQDWHIEGNMLGGPILRDSVNVTQRLTIVGNTWANVGGAQQDIIGVNNIEGLVIVANNMQDLNGYDPLGITDCPGIVIIANVADNCIAGFQLDGCDGAIVANNQIGAVDYIGEHGIELVDCSDCLIQANLVGSIGENADDTYDNIHLSGSSDRNFITANMLLGSATSPAPRYAINIAGDCNRVVGNNGDGQYASGNINDGGTNTVLDWPNDPIDGDNIFGCTTSS